VFFWHGVSVSFSAAGQPTGDRWPNPLGVVSESREAIRGGQVKPKLSPQHDTSPQHEYNVIGSFEPAAAVHTVLNREVTERCEATCRELPPQHATHHASGGNVITLSDDSSGSDTIGNEKPETVSFVAKRNYMTRSKGLHPLNDIGHGILLGKSRRKSRLKTTSHPPIARTDCS